MKGMFLMTASISLFAVLHSASSFAAFGEETYPTIAEIDAEIAGLANQYGARTLWREFEATAGRIKDLQDRFPTQEVLQVQWHVVSNMFSGCYPVAAVTNDNQVNYQGLNSIIWLHLTKYRLFHSDTNALMFVADCVSNALPIDVSHEEEDKLAAWRLDDIADFGNTNGPLRGRAGINYGCYGERTRACIFRYMKWGNFNVGVERFREMVFDCFCALIMRYLEEYPEPVRRSLWEEFCRRSGASDKERSHAHGKLYYYYKITYP